MALAGLNENLSINEPIRDNTLNIYTVTGSFPALPAIKEWRSGNAVYQPDLDTIFVDQKQIKSAISDGPVSPQFLLTAFIFFHELGHKIARARKERPFIRRGRHSNWNRNGTRG
jgi:hypothetical protein